MLLTFLSGTDFNVADSAIFRLFFEPFQTYLFRNDQYKGTGIVYHVVVQVEWGSKQKFVSSSIKATKDNVGLYFLNSKVE